MGCIVEAVRRGGDLVRQAGEHGETLPSHRDSGGRGVQVALHRFGLQKRAFADEEIILGQQPDEIQPKLPGGGLDTETRIRHAAGDIGRDGGVREFHLLAAGDFGLIDLVQGQ